MRSSAVLISLLVLASCASKPARPIARQLIENAKYTPQDLVASVQLMNGNWDGPSDTGFSHPYVSMMPDFTVYGDINGDGSNEAVVIVHESGGGSGIFRVLALFARPGNDVQHLGSVPLGDRIQIRSVQIQPGQLIAEYVRQAENEPHCCPTEMARTRWNYANGKFAVASDEVLGKLSAQFLAGTTWELQPPTKPPITLTFFNGDFSGETGCNHYNVPVKDGEYGGAIVIDHAATTLRDCTGSDEKFLDRLQHASRMGFRPDRLWMSYDLGADKESGTLEFKEAAKPTSSQP
jgi:hypothetical protein